VRLLLYLPDERATLRERAQTGEGSAHPPAIVADLTLGLKFVLGFALGTDAITHKGREEQARRGWKRLTHPAAQAEQVQSDLPRPISVSRACDQDCDS
jgi:hypothetical protein